MKKKYLIICLLFLGVCLPRLAAQVSIKTSLTQLGTTTLHTEVAVPVSRCISLHLPISYNPWVFRHNARLQQLTCLPGVRFWKQQTQVHYFLSTFAVASRFHFGGLFKSDYRYDGEVYGAGVGGGYAWVLGTHWNLEAEMGVGFGYMEYDKCHWERDSRRFKRFSGLRVFPAKFDVNICYIF